MSVSRFSEAGPRPDESNYSSVLLPSKPPVPAGNVVPRTDASLVECRIFTGCTPQIRVHLREIGHPMLGDPIYAHPSRQPVPLILHARQLGFRHPTTGETMVFRAEISPEFETWTRALTP